MSDPDHDRTWRDLSAWPAEALTRLQQAGITDPRQLLAIAETPDGRSSLAAQTGLPAQTLDVLIERTRAAGGEPAPPNDTSDYGLGALPPGKMPDE